MKIDSIQKQTKVTVLIMIKMTKKTKKFKIKEKKKRGKTCNQGITTRGGEGKRDGGRLKV